MATGDSEPTAARGAAHVVFLVAPFAGLGGALALGAVLEPDARGLGTHEQLGFAPCGFRAWLGRPCPTCGVTTSVVHVAQGDVGTAWSVQPAGVLLALSLCAAALGAVCVHRGGGDLADVVRRRAGLWLAVFGTALMTLWVLRAPVEPGQGSTASSPGSTTSSGS